MKLTFDRQAVTEAVIYLVSSNNIANIDALKRYSLPESTGKLMKVTWLYQTQNQPAIVLIGLGDIRSINLEKIRQAAATAGRAVEKENVQKVTIDFSGIDEWIRQQSERTAHAYAAWVEGWMLGTYVFDRYKRDKRDRSVREFVFADTETDEVRHAVEQAKQRAAGTILARDLGNEPPNHLRPLMLADRVKQHFSNTDVEVNVHTGEALEKLEMNGIQTVGKGSKHPPALIEMRYCTDSSRPLIALVGKGITFDTGGISLKKARDLSDMRLDMAGAAAVIGAMDIIVQSDLGVNVAALIATAENAPDGGAMLPGEVITYKNGVSVQVGNTDAEGRLVLADALIRAQEFGAQEVIDIATLTGACVVALGERIAGVWSNDESMLDQLKTASNQTGDKVWPMPLEEEYDELLKSVYADTSNISKGPYAGSITAALFLKKFVEPDVSWTHVDMAGPMESTRTSGYLPAGATGFGARLLANYVLERKQ